MRGQAAIVEAEVRTSINGSALLQRPVEEWLGKLVAVAAVTCRTLLAR